MVPEVYVVRVYRRRLGRRVQLVGRVEAPGGSRYARFASLADLAAILGAPRMHLKKRSAKKSMGQADATTVGRG